jgi:hypothetical protein
MLRAIIRALRTTNQRINQTSIKGQSRVFQALIGILQTSIKANQSSIKERALIQDKGDLLSKLIELSKQEKDTRSKWMKSLKILVHSPEGKIVKVLVIDALFRNFLPYSKDRPSTHKVKP